jgi:hypothetical protein
MPFGLGARREQEGPWSAFGENAPPLGSALGASVGPRAHVAPSQVELDGPPSAEAPAAPGSDRRTVGRPRVTAVLGWAFMDAIGVGLLLTGDTTGLVVGLGWLLLIAPLTVLVLRSRVVVDGRWLFTRGVVGWRTPVDLQRLRTGDAIRGPKLALRIELADADHRAVQLDAVNMRLAGVYRELARHAGPPDWHRTPALERRIAPYR